MNQRVFRPNGGEKLQEVSFHLEVGDGEGLDEAGDTPFVLQYRGQTERVIHQGYCHQSKLDKFSLSPFNNRSQVQPFMQRIVFDCTSISCGVKISSLSITLFKISRMQPSPPAFKNSVTQLHHHFKKNLRFGRSKKRKKVKGTDLIFSDLRQTSKAVRSGSLRSVPWIRARNSSGFLDVAGVECLPPPWADICC